MVQHSPDELLISKGFGISILVPLHLENQKGRRAENWEWLKEYWKSKLPCAEIVIGCDEEAARNRTPFSKSVAVNNAISKAHGDIFVIIDADVYIPAKTLVYCAEEIRLASKKGKTLWFIPYRQLFRLTKKASSTVLRSSPKNPVLPSYPPSNEDFTNREKHEGIPISCIGHWYGAMIQITSREAFDIVGGWDTRFKGWGGEDHAAMVAMDTLYGPHKTLPSHIFHLWHPILVPETADDPKRKKRLWSNQGSSNTNNALSGRYYWAQGNPRRMRRLVDEFKNGKTPIIPHHRPCPPTVSS